MNEHPAAAGQPVTGFDRHPANLPGLIVEQEVLDDSDLAVARRDRATRLRPLTANSMVHSLRERASRQGDQAALATLRC